MSENIGEKIVRQIVDTTGEIDNLVDIKTHNVFNNRWRVNIWTSYVHPDLLSETKSQRIEYSYFIHVDDSGNIIKCSPELGTKNEIKWKSKGLPYR